LQTFGLHYGIRWMQVLQIQQANAHRVTHPVEASLTAVRNMAFVGDYSSLPLRMWLEDGFGQGWAKRGFTGRRSPPAAPSENDIAWAICSVRGLPFLNTFRAVYLRISCRFVCVFCRFVCVRCRLVSRLDCLRIF
jgi:hypothetical protein